VGNTDAHNRLKGRATDFHHALEQAGAYREPISVEEFLQRVDDEIQRIIKNMETDNPWITLLCFAERLLLNLEDVLYISGVDVMDGATHFFDTFTNLLSQAGFDFSWEFDEGNQRLHYRVGDYAWDVHCETLRFIDEPLSFSRIQPELFDYLKRKGWTLYPVVSLDAYERYMLFSNEGFSRIREFIIPGYRPLHSRYDERINWLFEGMPEDKKPDDPWQLLDGPIPE
jgi:hypothetical protein